MEPRIEILHEKLLIGKRMKMSFANNKTVELWKSFMPWRNEIRNKKTSEFISMQIFDPSFNFMKFDLNKTFEKWATVEVSDFESVPDEMETFILKEGLYAVFIHKGAASSGYKTFQYIFETWLPNSEYIIDNRPHFEILGEKYKNEDTASEEEIWIPIKKKS